LLDAAKEHYQAFDSVDDSEAAADEAHKTLFNAAKVRDVIWCQEHCQKGFLCKTLKIHVCLPVVLLCYTNISAIVVRQNCSCRLPVETQYHSTPVRSSLKHGKEAKR